MKTLEEEVLIPLQRHMASLENIPAVSARLRLWPGLFIVAISLVLGCALAGLVLLKNEMNQAWRTSLASYDWLVLAEGDTVAMDEVGRYLKKLDGVENVLYVPASETLEKSRMDSALADNLSLVEGNPFPSAWKVHWNADDFNPSKIRESSLDVRSFPGVLDIASDPASLEKIHYFRKLWIQTKVALALLMVFLTILVSLSLGRLIIAPWPSWLSRKTLAMGLLLGGVSTTVGAVALFFLW